MLSLWPVSSVGCYFQFSEIDNLDFLCKATAPLCTHAAFLQSVLHRILAESFSNERRALGKFAVTTAPQKQTSVEIYTTFSIFLLRRNQIDAWD